MAQWLQAVRPWTQRLVLISVFHAHSPCPAVRGCLSTHFPDLQYQAQPGATCLPVPSLESRFLADCSVIWIFLLLTVPGTEMARYKDNI